MHTSHRPSPARVGVVAAVLTLALAAGAAKAQVRVDVTNLVTDDQLANPAQTTDPGLVNAWGLSYGPSSPFWVSSNGAGTAVLYSVNPVTQATTKVGLTVTMPDVPVTGQVFNSASATGAFNRDNFLFVSEGGAIAGWRNALGTAAEILQSASNANVYKGAAFATLSGNSYLYSANFRNGSIDILKGQTGEPDLAGNFTDPGLPNGYAPFNIQNLAGTMYVTYAVQDGAKHDEVAGAGLGIVDSFDTQGNFVARVATAGTLDAPWGLAIAPSSFGALAGALLVGNFGDGRINAFDVTSHNFLGQLAANDGTPLEIDGLWAIAPGNGGGAGSSAALYFTAGPGDESHGLFGVLTPVPEPSSALLLLAGLGGIAVLVRRRSAARRR
ncbi:MAG TPA: TIGR03118 family protein [Caldimonas sp.]|jgi:uncharacterized protein (TIGR03118 family)